MFQSPSTKKNEHQMDMAYHLGIVLHFPKMIPSETEAGELSRVGWQSSAPSQMRLQQVEISTPRLVM